MRLSSIRCNVTFKSLQTQPYRTSSVFEGRPVVVAVVDDDDDDDDDVDRLPSISVVVMVQRSGNVIVDVVRIGS
jgi:hypothetical protein